MDNFRPTSEPHTADERLVERTIFASRWLLAPFYVGLAVSLVVLNSLIVLILLVFLAIRAACGIGAKTITSIVDGINAVTKTFAGFSGLVFLPFVGSPPRSYRRLTG